MRKRVSQRLIISLAVFSFVTLLLAGCRKGNESGSQPAPSSSPAKAQTPFERDLDYVRTGQFAYMFVFSRKDGDVFTSDDIAHLKANSPPETNQWVYTDGRRRIIAGTNFEFKQEQFDALNQRFNIENWSGK